MTDVTFDNPAALHGLWLAVLVAAVGVLAPWRRRWVARRFADGPLAAAMLPARSSLRALLGIGLAAGAVAALVVALAGPRWGERAAPLFRRDVESVILLDVSRSMLAQDAAPSRLARAKLAISDDLLPVLGGERVGLVVFAGEARTLCPLTVDYDALRRALDEAGPHAVRGGGSLVGDGLRAAGDLFTDAVDAHRLVVLLTDGEDQGSFPVAAAAALWSDRRATLLVVGLGDARQGRPIPLGDGQYLETDGQRVRTRADLDLLARVARAVPGGVFLPAATGNFDLGAAYRQAVRGVRMRDEAALTAAVRPSQHHWFAALALLLVLAHVLLPAWPRRVRTAAGPGGGLRPTGEARQRRGRWREEAKGAVRERVGLAPVVGAVLLVFGLGAGVPETAREWIERGNVSYAAGEFPAALNAYERAVEAGGAPLPESTFNQALARYKLGETNAARALWQGVQSRADARFEARVVYNLGNCDYSAALDALQSADMTAAAWYATAARARYCDAVQLDPTLDEARVNLELADRLLRRIEKAERETHCDRPSETGEAEGDRETASEGETAGESRDTGTEEGEVSERSREPPAGRESASGEARASGEPTGDDRSRTEAPRGREDGLEMDGADGPAESAEQRADEGTGDHARQRRGEAGQPLTAAELEVRMTPAEAERLLQRLREAHERRRAAQRAREHEAELESLRAPAAAGY